MAREKIVRVDTLMEEKEWAKALELCDTLLDDPKLRSDDFFQLMKIKGQALGKLKRFSEAREIFLSAIGRADQQNKRDLIWRFWKEAAVNEEAAGNLEGAIADLRRALSSLSSRRERYFEHLAENYYEQGRLFFAQNDFEESRLYYELALAYAETEGDTLAASKAHYGLGRYYRAVGEQARAGQHFSTSLAGFSEGKDKSGVARVRRQIKALADERKSEEKAAAERNK
jgi:tetratricopeptide (TPR) repeat protein